MRRRVTIALHAQAADLAGLTETGVEVSAAATPAELKRALAREHPRLAPLLPSSVIATEREYLADEAELDEREERLHLIPPVSGG
jgi:hypothetical protein